MSDPAEKRTTLFGGTRAGKVATAAASFARAAAEGAMPIGRFEAALARVAAPSPTPEHLAQAAGVSMELIVRLARETPQTWTYWFDLLVEARLRTFLRDGEEAANSFISWIEGLDTQEAALTIRASEAMDAARRHFESGRARPWTLVMDEAVSPGVEVVHHDHGPRPHRHYEYPDGRVSPPWFGVGPMPELARGRRRG